MPAHWLLLSMLLADPAQQAVAPVAPSDTATAERPDPAMTPPLPAVANAVPSPAFMRCLAELRPRVIGEGIRGDTFDQHVSTLVPDMTVLDLLDAQPEFTTAIWDYLAALVDEERVQDGRAMLAAHADTLGRVEQAYGVDPASVVAVWGVESNYGKNFGSRPLLNSLATLSCNGRRQSFFRGELVHALRIVQDGDVRPDELVGSWAGAFGHTQFMPSTFQRIAVDFDGDGRRDLVGSIPDALASTARYLERSGWKTGQPWGHEVRLPSEFDASVSGRKERRPLSYWTGRGVTRIEGESLDGLQDPTPTALLMPAGKAGPTFLVFKNFDAIYSYNASESYALAIALLSDRLRGGAGLQTKWPTDDPGLSRQQRRELQGLLLARGHQIGEVDGMIGSKSRVAIKDEQRRLQMPVDGRAGQRLLESLRSGGDSSGTSSNEPAPLP